MKSNLSNYFTFLKKKLFYAESSSLQQGRDFADSVAKQCNFYAQQQQQQQQQQQNGQRLRM